MGTLTADQQRLPGYCDHKLPTSCRLSSIPQCCACADERAHAASYSTYIDGIGYVPRGNRWQRYCWFCKEFWQHRVEASGLRPGQTRIPEVPDQTEFLRRWYEFHQGYRVAIRDGVEERIAVVGEDFRDVSPGFLPRTLEELRAGRVESELAELEATQREARQREQAAQATEPTGPSLEDALNELFEAAESEENSREPAGTTAVPTSGRDVARTRTNIHAQSMNPTRNREYQARRIAALRRELNRMRNGIERVISGLRYLGENVPDHTEATSRLAELGQTLDSISGIPSPEAAQQAIESVQTLTNSVVPSSQADRSLASIQARVHEERRVVDEARRGRDQAASELDLAEQEFRSAQARLRQLQSEERRTESYIRLFGTREEMLAQGENYISPVGDMYERAWERYRVAEEVRRETETLRQVVEDEMLVTDLEDSEAQRALSDIQSRARDVWGVPMLGHAEVQPLLQHPDDPSHLQNSEMTDHNTEASNAARGGLEIREEYYRMLQGGAVGEQGNETTGETSESNRSDRQGQPVEAQHHVQGSLDDTLMETSENLHDLSAGDFAQHVILAGPPGQQLDTNPLENNDRGLDAEHVLGVLARNENLRSELVGGLNLVQIQRLQLGVQESSLTSTECEFIQDLLDIPPIIWGTGLPSERNYRRRRRGEEVNFTPDALELARGGQAAIHDVEIMAECFQMSSELRSRAELSGIQRSNTLDRLQRGQRTALDREVLIRMIQNEATLNLARDLQNNLAGEPSPERAERIDALQRARQESARQGDFSRAELNAQREATHAFALAAGRSAMQTGPTALLQRMAERSDGHRAAYERLRDNGYVASDGIGHSTMRYRPLSLNDFTAAPSMSDSEQEQGSDNEARGLDAQETGRPDEPMADEEMTIKLDCRICYTQLADIACLPCGHLVMCRWCSEQHSPVMAHDRTRPRRPAGCPVCRKAIRQKVRMFRA